MTMRLLSLACCAFLALAPGVRAAEPAEAVQSVRDALVGWAATDFATHGPKIGQVRNVRLRFLDDDLGERTYVLCGEVLPADDAASGWTPFATIRTDPYEQWLGGQAKAYCAAAHALREGDEDLSRALEARQHASRIPVEAGDVTWLGEATGVDRQPTVTPLPGGGFVLVYSRYAAGDIDSSGMLMAVSSDGRTVESDEALSFGNAVEDAPSFVTIDGDTWLYFASADRDLGNIALWRARLVGTMFSTPESLPAVPGLVELGQWPRWVDTGADVFLTFRGLQAGPAWLELQDGVAPGPIRPLVAFPVAYPRVVAMAGGGCFSSFQRPPEGGYMATYTSVSDDCTEWSEPVPVAWPASPGKPDVHDAFALPRLDSGVDIYYVYPALKEPEARFNVGFVLYRRAILPDGTLGPEEQLTDRDAFEPFAPTAHRRPDGTILVSFSDIRGRGEDGVSAARMALFELARDAAR